MPSLQFCGIQRMYRHLSPPIWNAGLHCSLPIWPPLHQGTHMKPRTKQVLVPLRAPYHLGDGLFPGHVKIKGISLRLRPTCYVTHHMTSSHGAWRRAKPEGPRYRSDVILRKFVNPVNAFICFLHVSAIINILIKYFKQYHTIVGIPFIVRDYYHPIYYRYSLLHLCSCTISQPELSCYSADAAKPT